MSLHAHIHQPNEVDFFAVNPPSLTNRERLIFEKNQVNQPSKDEARVRTVVSHNNDPVLHLGSYYLPEGTTIYRHGNKNENPILAHAKSADCSTYAPEAQSTQHDNNKQGKAYSWKAIKTVLFIIALLIQIVTIPVRAVVIMARKFSSYFNNKHKSSDDSLNSSYKNEPYSDDPHASENPYQQTKAPTSFRSSRFFGSQPESNATEFQDCDYSQYSPR